MINKIKLLIVEPISDLGGVSQYILSTTRYLPLDKYEVHVAAFGNGPLFELLKRENIFVHTSKTDYSLVSFLYAVFAFRRFLKRERFDVIHAHTAKAGFLCSIANRNLHAKIIYMGHGFRFAQKRNPFKKIFSFCLEAYICNSSTSITLESNTEYNLGISKGLIRDGKSRIVPMSIDVGRFINIAEEDGKRQKEKFGIPANAFVVGMLGRIAFQKDPETFIKAASILNSQIDNIYFLWVGDGELRAKVVNWANCLKISNKMIITGRQDSKDIAKLLSAMDVLLFSSRFEGLPTALLEAMAAKKLIVAAHVGSIQDVIRDGKTGWLFDAGDYIKAASTIKNIYENKSKLSEIGDAAFELVVDHYSPKEKMAKQFQIIYEDVIKSI